MKLSAAIILAAVSSAAAFAPATQGPQSTALNAQIGDRKAFLAAAGASIFAAAPMVANAGTMGQELVKDPTEVYVQLYSRPNYWRIFCLPFITCLLTILPLFILLSVGKPVLLPQRPKLHVLPDMLTHVHR